MIAKASDFEDMHKIELYSDTESTEEKIEKHAMLEALFET